MQGHDFVYLFTDRPDVNPLFWGVGDNGKAKLSAKPYLLEFSPEGWLDVAIQNVRNRLYWGIDRSVTIPFSHIEDGAKILKTIFYRYGPEKPVYLKICRQVLDFEPNPNGVLEFITGGAPFVANTTSAGKITGIPGSTVFVRFFFPLPIIGDTLTGNFDAFNFLIDYTSTPPTYTLTIPASGVINFSITYTQGAGSTGSADMQLVNLNGNVIGSYGFWYKQIYCGQVNGPDFDHDGPKVTVSTLEDGLPKYLKANENTTIELAMNVPEAVYWKADGILLKETANFIDLNGVDISMSFYGDEFFGGALYINSDGKSTGMIFRSEDIEASGGSFSWDDKLRSLNYLGTAFGNPAAPIIATVKGTLEFVCTGMNALPAYAAKFRLLRSNQLIGNQNDYLIYSTAAMVVGQTYTHDYEIDVPLQEGEKLFREGAFFGSSGSDVSIAFTENSKFTVSYSNKYQTTYIRALRPQYVLDKLLRATTDNVYGADPGDGITNYFGTSNYYNMPLTCGNAIRGFDDAVMKINFTNFFKHHNAFDAVGIMDMRNGLVRFDRKKNLIDFTKSISLGSVWKLKTSLDKSFAFNELATGYPEVKNESGVLTGNDAFNCLWGWSLGTTLSPAKLDKSSPFKTDCYEMENIRIATSGKTSNDFKDDNDIYLIHILNTLIPAAGDIPAHYELDRSLNAFITGVTEPLSAFNFEFSQKRCIYRNGDFFRSSLFRGDNMTIGYRTCDKNNKVVTTIGANVIEEKADVNIGSLAAPFFFPVLIQFNCLPGFDLLELLDSDPLQLFDWDFYGTNYKGIMIKASLAPGSNQDQVYQMLSTADNDLEQLIDYYG